MLLCELNPFVRYAHKGEFRPLPMRVRTYDGRLFYLCGGSVEIRLKDRTYSMVPGSMILFPPGTLYSFSACRDVEMLTLNFDYTSVAYEKTTSLSPVPEEEPFSCPPGIVYTPFLDCPALCAPIFLSDASALKDRLEHIVQEVETARLGYREKVSALLKDTMVDALRLAEGGTGMAAERILVYLREHFPEPLSAEDISRVFGYHPVHLNRLMKKLTGTTLHRYLLHLRLSAAKELLGHSEESVEEIALRCGFHSPTYFSDCFRRETGFSPLGYRKQAQTHL